MRDISNDTELKNIFEAQLKQVIDSISERILNVLLDYIRKDVYDNNEPTTYERTWQFLNSWINQVEASANTGEVIAEIFSDSSRMDYIPEKGIHGSREYGDIRNQLSYAIETGTMYSYRKIRKDRSWNPAAKKRRFFQDTISELDKRGQIWKWFEEEMRSRGIAVEKGGSTNLTPSGGY